MKLIDKKDKKKKMKIYYNLKLIISIFILILFVLVFNIDDENEKTWPYNRYKYLKEYKKELCIYLPAQELEATGPFNSILVQYGINVKEFAEKFNKESIMYPPGLRIPVSIFYTMKEKRYTFCFRPLQLRTLLENVVTFDETRLIYKLHVVDLYKIFLIRKAILHENNEIRIEGQIFGTLKSFDYPVIIFFDPIDPEDDNYKKLSLSTINKINRYYVDEEVEIINEDHELDSENNESESENDESNSSEETNSLNSSSDKKL